MCTVPEYWARITRIPLFFDRNTDDGEAAIYRNQNGQPVRVTKPDSIESDEKREAAVSYYESTYTIRSH